MLVIHGLGMGGAEMMVKTLACSLHGAGYPVEVVSLHGGDTSVADMIREGGVEVVALEKHKGFDLGVVAKLRSEMIRFQPTVVHTHLPVLEYVVPAVKLYDSGLKVVHTFHSIASMETRNSLLRVFCRRVYRSGVVVPVALNDEVRNSICEDYGLSSSYVRVVRNGVDLARFRRAGERRAEDGTLRLLCVARFEDVKNHALLIETLAKLAPKLNGAVKLTLVGDGPLYSEVMDLAASLGVRELVDFVGRRSDTTPFFGSSDVYVLLSKYEGLPMSVIEAMASGLPVVASNVGGLPGIVKPGVNGELVGLDAEEAARAILGILYDSELYQHLSKGAYDTSLGYSAERMMEGYLDLYR